MDSTLEKLKKDQQKYNIVNEFNSLNNSVIRLSYDFI